jgi:hypothetical protein
VVAWSHWSECRSFIIEKNIFENRSAAEAGHGGIGWSRRVQLLFGGYVPPLLWQTRVPQRTSNGLLLLAYFLDFNFPDTRRNCIRPGCARKKNPSMIEFQLCGGGYSNR